MGQNSDECLVACGHAPRPESLEPDALLDGDAPRPLGVEALPVLLGGHISGMALSPDSVLNLKGALHKLAHSLMKSELVRAQNLIPVFFVVFLHRVDLPRRRGRRFECPGKWHRISGSIRPRGPEAAEGQERRQVAQCQPTNNKIFIQKHL